MSTDSDATWFVWRTGGGLFGRNKQWSDYYVQLRNGHGRQDTFWCASEDDANRLAAKLNADHNAAAAAREALGYSVGREVQMADADYLNALEAERDSRAKLIARYETALRRVADPTLTNVNNIKAIAAQALTEKQEPR